MWAEWRRGPVVGLLGVALLMTGCLGAGQDPLVEPSTDTDLGEAAGADVHALAPLTGCRQYHTIFKSPAVGWDAFIPEGFTLVTDATGLMVDVFAGTSLCDDDPSGQPVGEMMATLPVQPPEHLADERFMADAVPLGGAVMGDALAAAYQAWGLGPFMPAGTIATTMSTSVAAAQVEEVVAEAGGETTTLRMTVQASSGPFPEGLFRVWVPHDGHVTGWVESNVSASENVGLGTVVFTSTGDPDAPPVTTGIAHLVRGADVTLVHVPLPEGAMAHDHA